MSTFVLERRWWAGDTTRPPGWTAAVWWSASRATASVFTLADARGRFQAGCCRLGTLGVCLVRRVPIVHLVAEAVDDW